MNPGRSEETITFPCTMFPQHLPSKEDSRRDLQQCSSFNKGIGRAEMNEKEMTLKMVLLPNTGIRRAEWNGKEITLKCSSPQYGHWASGMEWKGKDFNVLPVPRELIVKALPTVRNTSSTSSSEDSEPAELSLSWTATEIPTTSLSPTASERHNPTSPLKQKKTSPL